ncbi:RICIN domain-containing protein [Streptomyces sp. NPDC020362]|uniref:RICIN domain-containing protein n=1 Tax=unclassified Streptomyces TaxID=2593676 RepID=UPI00340618FE
MGKNARARRLLTVPTVFVAGGILLLPAPARAELATSAADAPRISGASFQIRNVQTGKCATIAGGTLPDNNLKMVQFTCDTDASRRWNLINFDGDSYQISNAKTGKCMTIAGGTLPDNNLEMVQFTCDTDPSRRYRVANWNGVSYQLVNVKTGKCATIAGGTLPDNNLEMVQFTCDSDPSRRWVLRLAG